MSAVLSGSELRACVSVSVCVCVQAELSGQEGGVFVTGEKTSAVGGPPQGMREGVATGQT